MLTLKPKNNFIDDSYRAILAGYKKEILEKEQIIRDKNELIRQLKALIKQLEKGESDEDWFIGSNRCPENR